MTWRRSNRFEIHGQLADQMVLEIDLMIRNYVLVLNGDKVHYEVLMEQIKKIANLIQMENYELKKGNVP